MVRAGRVSAGKNSPEPSSLAIIPHEVVNEM